MKEITCPYCEHEYDLCHDDGAFYNQDGVEVEECPNCEKSFLVHSSVSWYFEAEKAECLNDGNHKWKKEYGVMYPELANREVCEVCDTKRQLQS